MLLTRVLAVAVLLLVLGHADAGCKTVVPLEVLDVAAFADKSWFVQQQQITGVDQPTDFFCSALTFNDEARKVPLFNGTVLAVHGYANRNTVNGKAQHAVNSSASIQCARVVGAGSGCWKTAKSCFDPNAKASDYWVVAHSGDVGSDANQTWAVVSAGQPTVAYDDGCTTKEDGVAGAGLWLLARAPVASNATLVGMRAAVTALGFTLERLHFVRQDGCTYKDAFLKQ
jgi:lipocalin